MLLLFSHNFINADYLLIQTPVSLDTHINAKINFQKQWPISLHTMVRLGMTWRLGLRNLIVIVLSIIIIIIIIITYLS